jgi:hypothetical protein
MVSGAIYQVTCTELAVVYADTIEPSVQSDGRMTRHAPMLTCVCCTIRLFVIGGKSGTAQKMIDGTISIPQCRSDSLTESEWELSRRPTTPHTTYDVVKDVLLLHSVAAARRERRFAARFVSYMYMLLHFVIR